MIMFPGGFSAGDEPDGSAKFFATAFQNAKLKEAVEKLLHERDGLALGTVSYTHLDVYKRQLFG